MLKMWNDSLNLNKRTKRRPIGSPAITLILFGIGQPAHPKLLVVVKNKNIQTRVRTGLFFSNHSNNVRQCASIQNASASIRSSSSRTRRQLELLPSKSYQISYINTRSTHNLVYPKKRFQTFRTPKVALINTVIGLTRLV